MDKIVIIGFDDFIKNKNNKGGETVCRIEECVFNSCARLDNRFGIILKCLASVNFLFYFIFHFYRIELTIGLRNNVADYES